MINKYFVKHYILHAHSPSLACACKFISIKGPDIEARFPMRIGHELAQFAWTRKTTNSNTFLPSRQDSHEPLSWDSRFSWADTSASHVILLNFLIRKLPISWQFSQNPVSFSAWEEDICFVSTTSHNRSNACTSLYCSTQCSHIWPGLTFSEAQSWPSNSPRPSPSICLPSSLSSIKIKTKKNYHATNNRKYIAMDLSMFIQSISD